MLIIEPIGGLGNRMRVIASALTLKSGILPIICIWNQNAELNCDFNRLFYPIKGLVLVQNKLFVKIFHLARREFQKGILKHLVFVNDIDTMDEIKTINDMNFCSAYCYTCEQLVDEMQIDSFVPHIDDSIKHLVDNILRGG